MRKGVILVVVIGVVMVIFTLALAALFLMTQESRIAEHKIRRTRAFFAAQAGMIFAFDYLRTNDSTVDYSTTIPIGNTVPGYPAGGLLVDIVYTADGSGPGGTNPVNITVNY